MGVEPTPSAWEADVLPIYYICIALSFSIAEFKKNASRIFYNIKYNFITFEFLGFTLLGFIAISHKLIYNRNIACRPGKHFPWDIPETIERRSSRILTAENETGVLHQGNIMRRTGGAEKEKTKQGRNKRRGERRKRKGGQAAYEYDCSRR